ncbi:D-aminoacyl-tRNA deacylase [Facilibium subflavum]|uniref:D-aminoacyl-tRNA deacylase n=1 Tax=Facilibium subflavum TaxID=2219058 RepID=UPI000E65292C|nr:D-aminoacyl-tRNA deacylase [Facilibium subflavum]
MLSLIQRVSHAHVSVNDKIIGQINKGIMALVCIEENDEQSHFEKMAHKLLNYRIFEDAQGKMNLGLKDIDGGLLLVPQFTLAADTKKGLRPSFSHACPPKIATKKFDQFCQLIAKQHQLVAHGEFGANMQVSLTNDGPVTLWLKV